MPTSCSTASTRCVHVLVLHSVLACLGLFKVGGVTFAESARNDTVALSSESDVCVHRGTAGVLLTSLSGVAREGRALSGRRSG